MPVEKLTLVDGDAHWISEDLFAPIQEDGSTAKLVEEFVKEKNDLAIKEPKPGLEPAL